MGSIALAILGFLAIIGVIVVLMKNWTTPAMAFLAVAVITGLILVLTGTADVKTVGNFAKDGIKSVHNTAILFIFSVLFFGIMTDAGMFDVIINALTKNVGNSVVGVCIIACIIAMIGHLDGGGASTFLITVPAMYPVFKKLKIRPQVLMLICVTAMGVMNLLPWGGPTMRAASILSSFKEIYPDGYEANLLWKQIIPMQVVGIVIALFTAVFWGVVEQKKGAGLNSTRVVDYGDDDEIANTASSDKSAELARPKLFVVNLIITLAIIAALVWAPIPTNVTFMIGCLIALFVNYPGAKLQKKIIKSHADSSLMMATTIIGAGVFLGVLGGDFKSGETTIPSIMDNMALMIAHGIPTNMAKFLPIIIGILSVPLAIFFSTDAYFYGILPVLIEVGRSFGVNPVHTAIAMVVCRNCGAFISPCVPATFLGIGLANVDIKDHIKFSFLWVWGVSIVCLLAGLVLGIIKF